MHVPQKYVRSASSQGLTKASPGIQMVICCRLIYTDRDYIRVYTHQQAIRSRENQTKYWQYHPSRHCIPLNGVTCRCIGNLSHPFHFIIVLLSVALPCWWERPCPFECAISVPMPIPAPGYYRIRLERAYPSHRERIVLVRAKFPRTIKKSFVDFIFLFIYFFQSLIFFFPFGSGKRNLPEQNNIINFKEINWKTADDQLNRVAEIEQTRDRHDLC